MSIAKSAKSDALKGTQDPLTRARYSLSKGSGWKGKKAELADISASEIQKWGAGGM